MKHPVLILAFFSVFVIKSTGQVVYGEKRVVFSAEKNIILTLQKDTSYERFTPTLKEIDSADLIIQNYFVAKHKTKIKQIKDYYRQYVGLKTKDDKKVIYIRASCVRPENFLENIFVIFGGGICYFETYINIIDKKVSYIYFNANM